VSYLPRHAPAQKILGFHFLCPRVLCDPALVPEALADYDRDCVIEFLKTLQILFAWNSPQRLIHNYTTPMIFSRRTLIGWLVAAILGVILLMQAGNQPQSAKKDTGTVEGVVVDANNKPIKDASVYADNLDMPAPARPHIALTDAEGHFVVDEVYPGDIVMRAFKEADKYADITGTWQEPIGQTNPELQMKAGDDFKGVVIRLGQKSGSLR
jgi:hypothetical protein